MAKPREQPTQASTPADGSGGGSGGSGGPLVGAAKLSPHAEPFSDPGAEMGTMQPDTSVRYAFPGVVQRYGRGGKPLAMRPAGAPIAAPVRPEPIRTTIGHY